MKKTECRYKKNRGFTLLELIIVLAIAGILASVALPSYTSMIRRNHVDRVARSFEGTLLIAQRHAKSSGRPVTICAVSNVSIPEPTCGNSWENISDASNNGQAGWIAFNNRNFENETSAKRDIGEVVLSKSTFDADNVAMSWSSSSRPRITISARNTSGTSGTMRVYSPSSNFDLPDWTGSTTAISHKLHETRIKLSSLGKITYEK